MLRAVVTAPSYIGDSAFGHSLSESLQGALITEWQSQLRGTSPEAPLKLSARITMHSRIQLYFAFLNSM